MERFFKVLLVLGIVLSVSSIYFLLTNSVFAIFTSTLGVMIVAFSVFEIIRMRKVEPRAEKNKPIASKAKKDKDDISWTYYDINEEDKKLEIIVEPEHKARFTLFSKLFHLFGLRKKPKMVGKGVNHEVKLEAKKVGKNKEKDKMNQLRNYILEAMKNNIPKKEIEKACLASDWPKDKVIKVMGSISNVGRKKSFFSLIVLVVITFSIMVGLILSGNFLIGYWLESLKLISRSAYYVILGLVVVSIGVILFDVSDRLKNRKKVYKIKTKESVSEIKEGMESEGKKVISAGAYSTDIDKLLDLVNDRKKLTIVEVSGIFDISKKEAEEWGKILKDEGLISLYYPTVGDVELRVKKKVTREEE